MPYHHPAPAPRRKCASKADVRAVMLELKQHFESKLNSVTVDTHNIKIEHQQPAGGDNNVPPKPRDDDLERYRILESEYRRSLEELRQISSERDKYFRKYTAASAKLAAVSAVRRRPSESADGGGPKIDIRIDGKNGDGERVDPGPRPTPEPHDLRARLREEEAERRRLERENQSLERQASSAADKADRAMRDAADARDATALEREKAQVARAEANAASERERRADAECARLAEEGKTLARDNAAMTRDNAALARDNAALARDRDGLQRSNAEAREKIAALERKISSLESRIISLGSGRRIDSEEPPWKTKQLENDVVRWKSKFERTAAKLDKARDGVIALKEKHKDDKHRLRGEIDTLDAQLATATAEIARLTAEARVNAVPIPDAKVDVKIDHAKIGAETAALREELGRTKAERDRWEAEARGKDARIQELSVALENLHVQIERITYNGSAFDIELVEMTKGLIDRYRGIYELAVEDRIEKTMDGE